MEMKLKRETTPFERSSRSSVLNVILSVASRSDVKSKGKRFLCAGRTVAFLGWTPLVARATFAGLSYARVFGLTLRSKTCNSLGARSSHLRSGKCRRRSRLDQA